MSVPSVMTCSGHDEAQQRIAHAVHEIQVLCDFFGYDPSQWLADAICHPEEAPDEFDCLICGGKVDLSNPIKPTEKVGPGRPKSLNNEKPFRWPKGAREDGR